MKVYIQSITLKGAAKPFVDRTISIALDNGHTVEIYGRHDGFFQHGLEGRNLSYEEMTALYYLTKPVARRYTKWLNTSNRLPKPFSSPLLVIEA